MKLVGTAPTALPALTSLDPNREIRQVVMVDDTGRAAAFTGGRCAPQAGHRVDDGVAAAGNMLASDETWGAVIDAYQKADGDLADRILAAMDAAEGAGGDARGRQSAHLLVVSGERTGRPWEGVLFDVRVDDRQLVPRRASEQVARTGPGVVQKRSKQQRISFQAAVSTGRPARCHSG